MKTIIKPGIWKIIKLFYENRNRPLHLREIARKVKMNESSISRHLNKLTKKEILRTFLEGNLKKFFINKNYIKNLFPLYDDENIRKLPLLRRNAIEMYIQTLGKKPIIMLIFGSTSKKTYKDDSDIDILEIYYSKTDNEKIQKNIEAQTSMRIQALQLTEKEFKHQLQTKEDKVIQSAVQTGIPVFNQKYYYELIYQ